MSLKPKVNEKVHYVASTTFTLDKCYSDLKSVGKGSYGVVCSAFSSAVNKKVAIKKITPMAKQISDAKHVLREIRLMRHMGKHENVVTLIDLAVRETSDELYVVMELLDSDLHRILQSKQELTENHYRHFFHQLLCGVKYLHDNRIIHRDLKPGNLLVTKDCKLRIADFGLARERPIGTGLHSDEAIDAPMTEHVVTRWYRPPELM
jgi:serine/threonine protein kinase